MDNEGFIEPIGPMGLTASKAISALGGSSERIASHLEWKKESLKRRSVRMPRKQQREVLDMLMAKVIAQNYSLLGYNHADFFFADVFEISIQNKDDSFWRIRLTEWSLEIMPETSPILLWFEGLEPRII